MGVTYCDHTTTNRVFKAVDQKSHIIGLHRHSSFLNGKRTILDGFTVARHDDWRELEIVVLLCDDLSDQYSYIHVTIFDSLLT